MTLFFDVYGSFPISREQGEIGGSQHALWETAEEQDDGISTAIGCYMFCLANGRNTKPWYVGKTIALGGFRADTFTAHKLKVYNDCISEHRGRPRLFLFPMLTTEEQRFSKNRSYGAKTIGWLERTLMGMALQRNDKLWNIRDLSLPRSVTVRGIIGETAKGRPHDEVREARRALFGH